MKKVFLFLLFTSAFLTGFSQYVTLYDDCDYRGRSRTLRPGRYNLDQTGFGGNRLSSIRIPNGLKVVLYDAPEPGQGAKIRMTSDNRCFDSDWNERAQYIVVEADNTGGSSNSNQYPTQQPSYPPYGSGAQVMIYEDCGLSRNGVALVPGRYDTRAMGLRNDVISSIRVPKGYSVIVYQQGGFKGESMTFYANVYCLDGRMNDQISSIIVNGPGSNNSPSYTDNNYNESRDRVTIYDQCSYGGEAVPLNPGRYNYNKMGLDNDRISSIRVPRGFRVIAYAVKDFQGPSKSFSYDENCLNSEWNNQISSIIVEGPGGNSGNNNYNPQPSYSQPESNNSYAGVTAYVASWFRGEHALYNEGRHDLRNASVRNNISSLSIQPGYRVTVYEDFGFKGRSQTFTSSVANLQGFGWNDNIRSMIVYRY